MPKSLSDGHMKVAVLTTQPANVKAPTVAELNAGIDASCRILSTGFTFGCTDSDKVAEKALCDVNNSNALSASNFAAAMTIWRYFNASTGVADPTEDSLWTAVKVKGTTLWIYARETGKLSTAAWAANDELIAGGSFLTDNPQRPSDAGGVSGVVDLLDGRVLRRAVGEVAVELALGGGPADPGAEDGVVEEVPRDGLLAAGGEGVDLDERLVAGDRLVGRGGHGALLRG